MITEYKILAFLAIVFFIAFLFITITNIQSTFWYVQAKCYGDMSDAIITDKNHVPSEGRHVVYQYFITDRMITEQALVTKENYEMLSIGDSVRWS